VLGNAFKLGHLNLGSVLPKAHDPSYLEKYLFVIQKSKYANRAPQINEENIIT
jgi:hypothetical protein